MMLSLWHNLHCSHHTFTHPLSVHYFLPLLLLILPLLLHTNRTAQSIADFSPNHENHDSILCSLIFSSNLHNTKLYSQSKYTCFSILGSKNHSIQSNADIFPSHVSQVFFLFRYLTQWSITQPQTLLQTRQHILLDSGFEESQHTSNRRLISYSRQSYFVFLLYSTYSNDLLHNTKLCFSSNNTCNYILDSKNHSLFLHYDYIEYKYHIIQFKSTHAKSICNHVHHIPLIFYTARRNARRDWIRRPRRGSGLRILVVTSLQCRVSTGSAHSALPPLCSQKWPPKSNFFSINFQRLF